MAVGLCHYCGVTLSSASRSVCELCEADRTPMMTDTEHRAKVLLDLLPEARWPDGRPRWMPHHLVDRSGFRFFHEMPGVVQVDAGGARFGYVDLEALRARLRPPTTPLATREPCPRCGVNSAWRQTEVRLGRQTELDGRGQPVEFEQVQQSWVCQACRLVPGDLDDAVARLVGLNPAAERMRVAGQASYQVHVGTGIARELGVTWFEHSGETEPATRLLGWWPPRSELCRRAIERYPDERYWSSMAAWEAAKATRQEVAHHG